MAIFRRDILKRAQTSKPPSGDTGFIKVRRITMPQDYIYDTTLSSITTQRLDDIADRLVSVRSSLTSYIFEHIDDTTLASKLSNIAGRVKHISTEVYRESDKLKTSRRF